MNHYSHPQSAVSFAVMYRQQCPDGVQPIRAIGAFKVSLGSGDDVAFERHHFSYRSDDLLGPTADMHSLVDRRTDCLTNIGPDLHRLALLPDDDRLTRAERNAFPIRDHHRHRRAHYISASERALSVIGRSYDIELAPPDADEGLTAARTPQRAQAIWLAWLTGVLSEDPQHRAMLAAYQAWHALERARPIQF
ncbi:hypothetical protein HKD42_11795 [Altererythrobacter sp. RZ02]|uniref:Uncharacterized protein n=1 Tax=Pontixanthobacter rizhaonensis TaxID=2730337 RepID=A0A848QRM7_9SPHN|nr:hypothetical protein [Pontixanthobacter rizhaonensis]NMW32745.1 hypothetical protein [Pontixanthobacter rizhaonensis]